MTTIGRQYVGPTRNYAHVCDVCGVLWHRTELRRTPEGLLVCPDDSEGRTRLECDMANAAGVDAAKVVTSGGRR